MVKIINRPERLTANDYEQEIQRYVDMVAPLRGVVAVGTVGSVGTIGYSDVDYLVIVNEEFDRVNAPLLFHHHQDRDRRVVLHAPLITSPELYPEMRQHLYLDDPTVLAGKIDAIPHGPASDSRRHTLLANLIDFCEARVTQQATSLSSGAIDQRHAMTAMWSSTHSAAISEDLGIELTDDARHTVDLLRSDRAAWRSGHVIEDDRFLKLYRSNAAFSHELLLAALAAESAAFEQTGGVVGPLTFTRGNKTVRCAASQMTVAGRARSISIAGRRKPVSVVVDAPIEMADHLLAYGFIPKGRAQAGPRGPAVSVLRERALFARRYYEFLRPLGLDRANGPYVVLPPTRASGWQYRLAAGAHRAFGLGESVQSRLVISESKPS